MPSRASRSSGIALILAAVFTATAIALMMPSACSNQSSTAQTSAPPPASPAAGSSTQPAPPNDMHFDSTQVTIKGKPFTLEIADDDEKIKRGLMYRDSMPADHGMLFLLGVPDTWSFWMKNTRIPLDIIYLDPAGKVVAIHHRKPFDENGMQPNTPALFVIELNAGRADAIGLKYGDVVSLPEKYLKGSPSNSEKKN